MEDNCCAHQANVDSSVRCGKDGGGCGLGDGGFVCRRRKSKYVRSIGYFLSDLLPSQVKSVRDAALGPRTAGSIEIGFH